mmetsp:Transcript_32088/g.23708  ORF Transcript_32088/g.23708 Transcript_32088/m.23708 type:complete len:89 (-) Transcript_32088:364-630(-)
MSMVVQMCWISMSPIAEAVANAYSIPKSAVNTISLAYMGIYAIANFPAVYALQGYGLRVGILIGTMLTFIGLWIKCLINYGFWISVVG